MPSRWADKTIHQTRWHRTCGTPLVSQYGIINWHEMYKTSSPAMQAYQRTLIGDPVIDKAVYDAASPMTYIRNAKAPCWSCRARTTFACRAAKRPRSCRL